MTIAGVDNKDLSLIKEMSNALSYMEQVAPYATGARAEKIMEKVRRLSSQLDWSDHSSWRCGASMAAIISNLPLDIITEDDIQLLSNWMSEVHEATWLGMPLVEKLLPRLLGNNESHKALILFSVLTMKSEKDAYGDDAKAVINTYHLRKLALSVGMQLGEQCGLSAVEMIASRLGAYLGNWEKDKYSYVWRPAIENHEQNIVTDDARFAVLDALREISLGAVKKERSEAIKIAEHLLYSKYPSIVRVGIYVCSENYLYLRHVFWAAVKFEWFDSLEYWHEIYWLIKKTFSQFSKTEKDCFLKIVESLEDAESEEYSLMKRRDILHAANGQQDAEVNDKYSELVEKVGPVREHPDFHIYSGPTVWTGERSPLTAEEVLNMSDQELVSFCRNFSAESEKNNEFSLQGLGQSIAAAVRTSVDGFASKMGLFINLDRAYQHGLLQGLEERWVQDGREINWNALHGFIRAILQAPRFRDELSSKRAEAWGPTVEWVISDIAHLMRASASHERELERDLIVHNLKIVQQLLDMLPTKAAGKISDAVFKTINSPRGKCLEAFVHLSITVRRIDDAQQKSISYTWTEVGTVFENELNRSEEGANVEFAVIAGIYCANLHFINPQWTEQNFNRLFPLSEEATWVCAAQGLAHQKYLYDWLYENLISGGHLHRMLFPDDLSEAVENKALQFLCIAYLHSMQIEKTEALLDLLINGFHDRYINHICWFFWTLRNSPEANTYAPKILNFMLRVIVKLKALNETNEGVMSALSQLMAFVDELNSEMTSALEFLAPFAHKKWHGNLLLENLARLAKNFPHEVSQILKAALEGFIPDFPPEDAITIVRTISDAGHKDEALAICNAYAERGASFLKPIYEELRSS